MRTRVLTWIGAAVLLSTTAFADENFSRPKVNPDGSAEIPSFTLPFSALASKEAKEAFANAKPPAVFAKKWDTIADLRKGMDEGTFKPWLAKLKVKYPDVTMEEKTMGGVFVQIFTPKDLAPENKDRMMINVHGGGFNTGGRIDSQVESIPVAAIGKIKVISIDYRMAPEYVFPAASEDVAAVYRELLKTHRPQNMALYGCSAGGGLTAQSIAWFQKEGLPNPAAIGIFCSSLGYPSGDSSYVTYRLGGALTPPNSPMNTSAGFRSYYDGAGPDRLKNPLVSPAASPELLKKFPPTLLITGTRAGEMSAAARSHIDLTKAGVDSRLYVWDAMDHGFFLNISYPESIEAYEIMTKFFKEQMDKANKSH